MPLPSKVSGGVLPVEVVASGGWPIRQVNGNGVDINDGVTVFSEAKPITNVDSTGLADDSSTIFSVHRKVTLSAFGHPVVRVDAAGNVVNTPLTGASAPTNSVAPKFVSSLDGTGSTVTAPVVGQTYGLNLGVWSGSPTAITWTITNASQGASGTYTPGDPLPTYLVLDADAGLALTLNATASNGAGSASASSSATSAVANIDLTNAITSITRTSASGVTPMTADIAFASNVYEGYWLDRIVYTDSGLSAYKGGDVVSATASHHLSHADLQAGATIDWSADGGPSIAATDWVQYRVRTTSPNDVGYSFTYATAISPTDAVAQMTWSTTDKSTGITVFNSNLSARDGNGSLRANRGISSGKFYMEFYMGAADTVGIFDSSEPLNVVPTTAAHGGTPSAHESTYFINSHAISYNTTEINAPGFMGGATFTGSIASGVLTVTLVNSGTLAVGQYVYAPGIPLGVTIASFGTGAGGNGTYNLSGAGTFSIGSTISLTAGPIVGMAVDVTNNKIWFALNNTWQGTSSNPSANTGPLSISGIGNPVYPAAYVNNGHCTTMVPGTTPGGTAGFTFTPPAGFVAP